MRLGTKNSLPLLIPVISIIIGAVIAMLTTPSPIMLNYFRNLAAGIVLAVVATEFVPQLVPVEDFKSRLYIILGLVMGATLLISARFYFDKYNIKAQSFKKVPWEIVMSICIDFSIDGFLIGIANAISPNLRTILGIALGAEMALISITIHEIMKQNQVGTIEVIGVTMMLTTSVTISMLAGIHFGKTIKGKPIFYAIIAFGTAALIWLITEELLVFNSKTDFNSILAPSMLFIGFMGVVISKWFIKE